MKKIKNLIAILAGSLILSGCALQRTVDRKRVENHKGFQRSNYEAKHNLPLYAGEHLVKYGKKLNNLYFSQVLDSCRKYNLLYAANHEKAKKKDLIYATLEARQYEPKKATTKKQIKEQQKKEKKKIGARDIFEEIKKDTSTFEYFIEKYGNPLLLQDEIEKNPDYFTNFLKEQEEKRQLEEDLIEEFIIMEDIQ